VPGYDVQTWLGLPAPRGTPEIVAKLNADARPALPTPIPRLNKIRLDVHSSTPDEK